MKTSLIQRVARMVSGAAHHIVDAAEDLAPEALMEQAVREIESAIEELENARGHATARRHLAQQRLSHENERHLAIDEECRVAMKKGRRELAQTAMGQMLDIESQVPVLEREIQSADNERAEIEGNIEALCGRRNEMREEIGWIRESARVSALNETGQASTPGEGSKRVRSASDAFDRAVERKTGLATSGSAATSDEARKRAELSELRRTHRIDERLREMESSA